MQPIWTLYPEASIEVLGYLPGFLDDNDPRSAREQLDTAYSHAGGWQPFKGFNMLASGELYYPGDPPTKPVAETKLRNEIIRLYEHSWVAIIQHNGSYEICRMD